MIKIKLEQLAKKLGKNISQIAKETGLNRNSVTALYHGKVDGIKFETLEKICSKYNIRIEDLVEYSASKMDLVTLQRNQNYYKQEAEAAPLPMWPIFMIFNRFPKKYFDFQFSGGNSFFRKDYAEWYWNLDGMNNGARSFYKMYNDRKKFNLLYKEFEKRSEVLQKYYDGFDQTKIHDYLDKKLISEFATIDKILREFWSISLFIDCFDPGFDQEKIKEITIKYDFDLDETGTLTVPIEPTFNNERELDFLKTIEKFINSKQRKTRDSIKKFVVENKKIREHIRKFNYIKGNYAKIEDISDHEIMIEIEKYLKRKKLFREDLKRLEDYSNNQKKAEAKVLKSHQLASNPLWFFQRLTFWREQRKKYNLMMIYCMYKLLDVVAERVGINSQYLKYINFEEIPMLFNGLINSETIRRRYENGFIIILMNGDYKVIDGEQALSIREELEEKLHGMSNTSDIIPGVVASRGYAKGIAKIILNKDDFSKLSEGEILVTGMTRPEFLPIMKKAGGIVTNEGGITCHAAIVSRELNKPCIIGAKNATQIIHDGDLIEVRANHGTVRILERSCQNRS